MAIRRFGFDAVARMLLGAIFVVHGINGFIGIMPEVTATVPDRALAFAAALVIAGLFPFINAIELVAGLFLLTNRFVPLALALLAPIVINLLGFYAVLAGFAPLGTALATLTLALELYLAWTYRDVFRPMLAFRVPPHGPSSSNDGGDAPLHENDRLEPSAQET